MTTHHALCLCGWEWSGANGDHRMAAIRRHGKGCAVVVLRGLKVWSASEETPRPTCDNCGLSDGSCETCSHTEPCDACGSCSHTNDSALGIECARSATENRLTRSET